MRALLRKTMILDAQDDAQDSTTRRGDDLPEELQRRSSRLEGIRKATAGREAEAAATEAQPSQGQAEVAEQWSPHSLSARGPPPPRPPQAPSRRC